ncbi:SMI1/KNR4 family protein [Deinococcus sp. 14RED07]|uniref:SMI1/KNR4 family protein n=1 Tax=Deinococcus sp. 14RED07 TaxID=2745874 RepID=UPI001E5217EA|nr:SMI1/KNR4 family protein [Deinococcus sp. 14RED07]MCD0175488.1 SMI1/KNR4 family protein [Deinococcus sp. 14RED07]
MWRWLLPLLIVPAILYATTGVWAGRPPPLEVRRVTPVTLPEPRDLPELLTHLDAWVAREVPLHHATLRPGVTDAALDAFEARQGVTLPEAMRALYRWHDGGDLFGLDFPRLESLEFQRVAWAELAAACMTDLDEDIVSHPPGAIRLLYATGDWLPFLHDGGGNHVALDMHPGPAGRVGQVVTTGRDEEHRFVLAPDLDTFLREYLRRLEAGWVTVRRLSGFSDEVWEVRLQEPGGRAPDGYGVLADLFPAFGAAPEHMDTRWP